MQNESDPGVENKNRQKYHIQVGIVAYKNVLESIKPMGKEQKLGAYNIRFEKKQFITTLQRFRDVL